MVAECVPGQLSRRPMVLMRVAFVMDEDEVGPHPHPEVVEELLQLGEVREVSFPEGQHLDLGLRGTGEESLDGPLIAFATDRSGACAR
jgi:hypothetical protein